MYCGGRGKRCKMCGKSQLRERQPVPFVVLNLIGYEEMIVTLIWHVSWTNHRSVVLFLAVILSQEKQFLVSIHKACSITRMIKKQQPLVSVLLPPDNL